MRKYPKTGLAAKELEGAQWKIGQALIEECGWPPKNGENDDTYAEMEKVSAELLAEDGVEIDVITLARYREVAARFSARRSGGPEPEIVQGVSWSSHRDAGSPEKLKKIVKKLTNEKKPLTGRNIRNARAEIEGRPTLPAGNPDALLVKKAYPAVVDSLGVLARLLGIRDDLKKIDEEFGNLVDRLSDTYVDAINETLVVIMNVAQKAVRRRNSKRNHLAAVGED